MKKGYFIALEGIDGSGKSALAEKLAEKIIKMGFSVLHTGEPTMNGRYGKIIHRILNHVATAPDPLTFQKLYVQDRRNHVRRVIKPALKRGVVVLSQRYAPSAFAFGMAEGGSYASIFALHKSILKDDFIRPDLTIILDVPARLAMTRIHKRGRSAEYFEKEKKLSKARNVYWNLVKKSGLGSMVLIDARKSLKQVVERALRALKAVLIIVN